MVTRCIGGLPGACASRCADEKFDFVEDMASAVNHCVYETLKGIEKMPFNVLSMDYVQDDIVERIIELNTQVLPDANLVSAASMQDVDEIFMQNQTLTSLSTNFEMPMPAMPPIEVRETCA